MKYTLLSVGAVMTVVLVVVSAGCVSPSTGCSSSTCAAPVTAEKNVSATSGLPDFLTAVTPLGITTTVYEAGSPQVASKGDTVSVYYTGTFENGTVLDSNMNTTSPVTFTLGNSSVIQGFEEAVTGMSVNQQKTVTIPAGQAYGEYNASLIRTVNRTGPIANTTFVEGQYYSIRDRTTNAVSVVKVLNVNPDTVTWDGNDPLAGQNFTFTIKLVGIARP
jgi:peptidylprolyl isomerase